MQEGVFLVLTSAIAIDGELVVPKRPDGRPTIVEVSDREAKNLLHRGKARLATADDMPAVEAVDPIEGEESVLTVHVDANGVTVKSAGVTLPEAKAEAEAVEAKAVAEAKTKGGKASK